jgi:hypothetical protein
MAYGEEMVLEENLGVMGEMDLLERMEKMVSPVHEYLLFQMKYAM